MGINPTKQDIAWLDAWQTTEGGTAAFNPLNTTLPESGATPYNTLQGGGHVWNYPTATIGTSATAATLSGYPAIIKALKSGDPVTYSLTGPSSGNLTDIVNELNTWGSHGFAVDVKGNEYPSGVTGASSNPFGTTPQGTVGSAAVQTAESIGPIDSILKAIEFLFSYRGLEVIGGGIIVLISLAMLMKEVGGPSIPVVSTVAASVPAAAPATKSSPRTFKSEPKGKATSLETVADRPMSENTRSQNARLERATRP